MNQRMRVVDVMLVSSGLPSNMWGEALYSACHILNSVPYKNFEKTIYELWRKREPNLKYLKVWGCLAKVNILINKKRKIGPKTVNCLLSITYRFLVLLIQKCPKFLIVLLWSLKMPLF